MTSYRVEHDLCRILGGIRCEGQRSEPPTLWLHEGIVCDKCIATITAGRYAAPSAGDLTTRARYKQTIEQLGKSGKTGVGLLRQVGKAEPATNMWSEEDDRAATIAGRRFHRAGFNEDLCERCFDLMRKSEGADVTGWVMIAKPGADHVLATSVVVSSRLCNVVSLLLLLLRQSLPQNVCALGTCRSACC